MPTLFTSMLLCHGTVLAVHLYLSVCLFVTSWWYCMETVAWMELILTYMLLSAKIHSVLRKLVYWVLSPKIGLFYL